MRKGNAYLSLMILFIVILFLFGMVNFVVYTVQDDVDGLILEEMTMNESRTVIEDTTTRFPSIFDAAILIIFAGLWVGGLAAAWSKDENPMLFGFMLLVCIAVLIAGMILGNSFDDFVNDDTYSSYITTFPKTIWILGHMLELGIMMLLSVLMTAMAKNKVG